MLISYHTENLLNICFHNATAVGLLGEEIAKILQSRHADLLAVRTIYDLPLGRTTINGNVCEIRFGTTLTMEVVPNYPPPDHNEEYDWNTIERIKIMKINDAV